jgi:hypothetical protein
MHAMLSNTYIRVICKWKTPPHFAVYRLNEYQAIGAIVELKVESRISSLKEDLVQPDLICYQDATTNRTYFHYEAARSG